MNLKDRLPQGKNVSVQIRNPGNLTDAMPISKKPSREQELLSKAQDTIREPTATVSSLTEQLDTEKTRNAEAVEKMSALSSQNLTLRSRAQELSLKNENLKALSDELHKQVNLSNVEAVISAQNLVFFTIQLLGQLIIQAGDVMFRHGRHWRKWLDTKTL